MGYPKAIRNTAVEVDMPMGRTGPVPVRFSGEWDVSFLDGAARQILVDAPLSEVLTAATELIAKSVKCDSCSFYLLLDGELVLQGSQSARPERVLKLPLTQSSGEADSLEKLKEPVVVGQSAYQDARVKMWFRDLSRALLESFVSVPIFAGNQFMGVVTVGSRVPHAFERAETIRISTIAFLAGKAIRTVRLEEENAKLGEQLKSRKVIERAKGILQERLNLSEREAYLMLQRESCRRRTPMKLLAEAIVLGKDLAPRVTRTR